MQLQKRYSFRGLASEKIGHSSYLKQLNIQMFYLYYFFVASYMIEKLLEFLFATFNSSLDKMAIWMISSIVQGHFGFQNFLLEYS